MVQAALDRPPGVTVYLVAFAGATMAAGGFFGTSSRTMRLR
jgi:hypothetical protein